MRSAVSGSSGWLWCVCNVDGMEAGGRSSCLTRSHKEAREDPGSFKWLSGWTETGGTMSGSLGAMAD
ncbi:MAG TPA: hypothetical protein V6D10_09595 [Trichocoleus sp.]